MARATTAARPSEPAIEGKAVATRATAEPDARVLEAPGVIETLDADGGALNDLQRQDGE